MSTIVPVEAVGFNSPLQKVETQSVSGTDFAQWLGDEVQSMDSSIKTAEQSVRSLALGEADNLHQVMINLATAKSEFDLAVEVRNRLVEGMKEVLRMSV